jgi:hypothetical protein
LEEEQEEETGEIKQETTNQVFWTLQYAIYSQIFSCLMLI